MNITRRLWRLSKTRYWVNNHLYYGSISVYERGVDNIIYRDYISPNDKRNPRMERQHCRNAPSDWRIS